MSLEMRVNIDQPIEMGLVGYVGQATACRLTLMWPVLLCARFA